MEKGERTSAEPVAARIAADLEKTAPMHERLLHLLANDHWDDQAVHRQAARYAPPELLKYGRVI